jgi:hypothetical protein
MSPKPDSCVTSLAQARNRYSQQSVVASPDSNGTTLNTSTSTYPSSQKRAPAPIDNARLAHLKALGPRLTTTQRTFIPLFEQFSQEHATAVRK